MSYPRYPAYKESGVAWLGNAPVHWESRRGKFLFERMQRPVREDDEIVTAFRDGTVTLRSNRRTEGFTFSDKEIGYQGIRTGDLVVHAMDGFAGAIGISDSDGKATPVYSVLRPHQKFQIALPYYSYLLRYLALSGFISSLSKGIRERSTEFRYAEIKELELPLFPVAEQQAIATFLDRKTAEIDALIAEKERLLALLKEQRAALITQAVTKGLDPSAPMKESGVAWLGEIPAHWEVKRLKWAIMFQRGHDLPSQDRSEEGEIPIVSSSGVSGYHTEAMARPPGIVTGRYGTIGNFHLISEDYWPLNTTLYSISLHGNDADYLHRMLGNLSPLFQMLSAKSAVPGIDRNDIHDLETAVPPLSEQIEIAKYIGEEFTRLDSLAQEIATGTERLQEYRTALISAAVTGKVDVRGA